MAFSQFDLATMLRCPATDLEGYRCLLQPRHEGTHQWGRCESLDSDGHRCALPTRHGGSHHQPWYDRHASAGDTQTMKYEGTEVETSALADRAATIAANYGWVERARSFAPGFLWRWPVSAGLIARLGSPQGRLTIEFDYRGRDEQAPSP